MNNQEATEHLQNLLEGSWGRQYLNELYPQEKEAIRHAIEILLNTPEGERMPFNSEGYRPIASVLESEDHQVLVLWRDFEGVTHVKETIFYPTREKAEAYIQDFNAKANPQFETAVLRK